jgi:hypothetical protein
MVNSWQDLGTRRGPAEVNDQRDVSGAFLLRLRGAPSGTCHRAHGGTGSLNQQLSSLTRKNSPKNNRQFTDTASCPVALEVELVADTEGGQPQRVEPSPFGRLLLGHRRAD